MKSALVDVPVLILFFNRPQQLSQVFEQVKKARPSRLFLYQDGARNERDLPGIKACREIVSQRVVIACINAGTKEHSIYPRTSVE